MFDVSKGSGGPAFPLKIHSGGMGGAVTYYGMSLRDWFAGQVIRQVYAEGDGKPYSEMAAEAYRVADAMVAVRTKPEILEDHFPDPEAKADG